MNSGTFKTHAGKRYLSRLVAALALTTVSLFSTGCSSVEVKDYKDRGPELKLEEYLNGSFVAYGMVYNRSGKMIRSFKVDLVGKWTPTEGVLDETFVWSDGEIQKRVWVIKKTGPKTFEGTAGDVIGVAKGEASGNAFRWQYTLRVPVGKKTYDVKVDDWMYLVSDQVILNKSTMSKFGFHVGEIQLAFVKAGAEKVTPKK